jgi:hypothetical protein
MSLSPLIAHAVVIVLLLLDDPVNRGYDVCKVTGHAAGDHHDTNAGVRVAMTNLSGPFEALAKPDVLSAGGLITEHDWARAYPVGSVLVCSYDRRFVTHVAIVGRGQVGSAAAVLVIAVIAAVVIAVGLMRP